MMSVIKRSLGCAVAASVLLAGACGGVDPEVAAESVAAEKKPVGDKEAAVAQTATYWLWDGLYQVSGSGNVYMVHGDYYCWVLDPGELGELASLNGWGKNTTYVSSFSVINSGRSFGYNIPGDSQAHCYYPNEMIKYQDRPEVYLLSGNGRYYCHVVDSYQVERFGGWGAVHVPDKPESEVKFWYMRTNTGACKG